MSVSIRRALVSVAVVGGAVLGLLGAAAPAMAADAVTPTITLDVTVNPKLGPTIVDGKGLTLYMFTPDRYNVSNCEGPCLNVWPPMMLSSGQTLNNVVLQGGLRRSKLGVAMRFDGSRQLTYNGWALYWWVQDKVPGDIKGQWVNNIWFTMTPTGAPNSDRV